MIFETSERTRELSEKLLAFMDKYIYPSEAIYQSPVSYTHLTLPTKA